MEVYLRKVIGLLTAAGCDADTISRILGVLANTGKQFVPIVNKGGKK